MRLRFFMIFAALAVGPSASPAATCSVDDLVDKIRMLDPGEPQASRDFTDDYGQYYRPTPSSDSPASYVSDLREAFRLAERVDDFHEALCELDYIFIDTNDDPDAPIGWGFWEGPNQGPATGKIQAIGLAKRLWVDSTFNKLTSTETFIVQSSLKNELPGFGYIAADENTREWALLAILAHEMAHVSYRDGDMIPSRCFAGWRSVLRKRNSFKKFHDVVDGNEYHRFDVLRVNVESGDYVTANRKIQRVYSARKFASLFALEAPEEDFPETLKLAILSKAGLARLLVTIDGFESMNVVETLNDRRSALYRKAECFWPYLIPPDLP